MIRRIKMSLTIKQIVDANKMNRAAQNIDLGTLLAQYGYSFLGMSEKSITVTSGSLSTAGNTQIIPATAGSKIVVSWIEIQNESSASTVYLVEDGTSITKLRVLAYNQGDGLAMTFPVDSRLKLTAGSALYLNLSGSNVSNYSIGYYTE
jgi:hypothetical protein